MDLEKRVYSNVRKSLPLDSYGVCCMPMCVYLMKWTFWVWNVRESLPLDSYESVLGDSIIHYYYVWSDKVSIMERKDTNDIIREIFRSFLHYYQKKLNMIKGSNFVFESVDLMDYKHHRVRLRRGGSYISPKWLENKKAVTNPKNKEDDDCLRWSIICALNQNEIIKKEFENIFEKIKHEDKDFSSQKREWENFV